MHTWACHRTKRVVAWCAVLVPVLMSVLVAGCGSTAHRNTGAVPDASAPAPEGRFTPAQAQDVTLYAMTLVGTPYRYGGNTPDTGFDCSGLIGHVYQTHTRVVPPRTTAKLQSWGQAVAPAHVRMGDLVVFVTDNKAHHAGIYVGSQRFVHAPSTGGVVRLDSLTSKYWSRQSWIVRRP
jgi:cell wall-associated NlpC family hydrolase